MLVMGMSSSVVIGLALVGLGAGLIIPAFGWRALLYFCGALSILCLLILLVYLPESLRFQIMSDPEGLRTRRLVSRLPVSVEGPLLVRESQSASSGAVAPTRLLRSPYAVRSVLLLFVMSASYSAVNFAGYWMPTLILREGMGIQIAALVGPSGQLFATIVSVFMSWLMDRAGIGRVLSSCFAGSAAAFLGIIAFIDMPILSFLLLNVALTLLGVGVSGSLSLMVGLYDASVRATAIGWIYGLARFIGGNAGALAGGFIIGANWTSGNIALVVGLTIVFATLALLGILRQVPGAGKPSEMQSGRQ
jgi:AAHS family 4-hydroxybenzoate transporter-like MFS transporter